MTLPVNEVFRSIQGEGRFTGTPAVFARLQGCDVLCPWCDTGHALRLDPALRLEPESPLVLSKPPDDPRWSEFPPEALAAAVLAGAGPIRHAVLTGGEPFLHGVLPLVELLEEAGFLVQVETSGSRPLACTERTWITLSPKTRKPPLEAAWERADEVKLPVRDASDIEFFLPRIEATPPEKVRLQPVDMDPRATALCVETCLKRNWRLSLQTHKFAGAR